VVGYLIITLLQIFTKCARERMLKIGQLLFKIIDKIIVKCHVLWPAV